MLSGETDNIKMWDLRTEGPVVRIPMQGFPFAYENKSGIFKMIMNEPNQLLVGSNGLLGPVEIDLRMVNAHKYYPVHNYQILTMCQGKDVLRNLVVTSGTTKTFSYEISVHCVDNLNKSIKYIPGHKGIISAIDIGNDCIASGGKDGTVRVLRFDQSKEKLRSQSKSITMHC